MSCAEPTPRRATSVELTSRLALVEIVLLFAVIGTVSLAGCIVALG